MMINNFASLTNFALAAACLVFTWKLWSQPAPRRDLNRNFFAFFGTIAVIALCAGLQSSFAPEHHVHWLSAIGPLMLILAGAVAYNLWLIDLQLLFGDGRPMRFSRWLFRLLFLFYALLIWRGGGGDSSMAVASILPAAIIMFIVVLLRSMRANNRFYFFGVAGLLLCFAGILVRVKQFSLNATYLNHDVLFDLLIGFGLWGVYWFGSRVARWTM